MAPVEQPGAQERGEAGEKYVYLTDWVCRIREIFHEDEKRSECRGKGVKWIKTSLNFFIVYKV